MQEDSIFLVTVGIGVTCMTFFRVPTCFGDCRTPDHAIPNSSCNPQSMLLGVTWSAVLQIPLVSTRMSGLTHRLTNDITNAVSAEVHSTVLVPNLA